MAAIFEEVSEMPATITVRELLARQAPGPTAER